MCEQGHVTLLALLRGIELTCARFITPAIERELEMAMANIPLIASGVAGALAVAGVGFALGTANLSQNAMERVEDSGGKPMKLASIEKDMSAQKVAAAEWRAGEAQRAAEDKIQCERDRQNASNQGAVVGGVAGAVIGSQLAGSGAKSEGAVIGGLGGVLAGRQIAKKDHRC